MTEPEPATDDEVWISADLICCAVALADPRFAAINTYFTVHRGELPPKDFIEDDRHGNKRGKRR